MLCLSICASCTNTTPKPTMERLHDAMAKSGMFFDVFPNNPTLYAVFFKTQDGIPRALVTSWEYLSNRGGAGDWFDYYFKDGQWQENGRKITEENYVDNSNIVWAREDDFYILTEKGKKPKLIVIHMANVGERDIGKKLYNRNAYEITIDSKGYLKTIPISEFSFTNHVVYAEWVDEEDKDEEAKPFPEIKLKSPNDKLEPVQVQTFTPKVPPVTEYEDARQDDEGKSDIREVYIRKYGDFRQPILFYLNPKDNSVEARSYDENGISWSDMPFDFQEFDDLRKGGIIKPFK